MLVGFIKGVRSMERTGRTTMAEASSAVNARRRPCRWRPAGQGSGRREGSFDHAARLRMTGRGWAPSNAVGSAIARRGRVSSTPPVDLTPDRAGLGGRADPARRQPHTRLQVWRRDPDPAGGEMRGGGKAARKGGAQEHKKRNVPERWATGEKGG